MVMRMSVLYLELYLTYCRCESCFYIYLVAVVDRLYVIPQNLIHTHASTDQYVWCIGAIMISGLYGMLGVDAYGISLSDLEAKEAHVGCAEPFKVGACENHLQ
jgi:hypothetical protein